MTALTMAVPSLKPARWAGLLVLTLIAAMTLAGPTVTGTDPASQSLLETLAPPGGGHLLGTDHLGRDMAARLLAGGQLTLGLALLSVLTAAIPGVLLGVVAGWAGGWADRLLASLGDTVLALPGLLLVLILAAISPGSWWALYAGLSLTLWVEYFRFVRARTRVLVSAPAVEASRLLGFGRLYVLRRHLLPELVPGLLTIAAFGAATAVTAVAALGFVGVGLRPPTAEWGVMMTELLPYWREAPWLLVQPVICLAATVAALHLAAGTGLK